MYDPKELSAIIHNAADQLSSRLCGRKPTVGIILGSGLGKLGSSIQDPITVPYSSIEGLPVSTAVGHAGNFICGTLGGKCVLAMQGRTHYYEGQPTWHITVPVRVMKLLGIEYLFVSNAAGGTNLTYHIGDIMVIGDHINLIPNPLIGPNLDEFGTRFPDMTHAYDPALKALARSTAAAEGIELKEGVYVACTGPSYETPAEYGWFRAIGADAVGMSTTPEVIVARHCGLRVFGVSVITDEAHEEFADDYAVDANAVVVAADAAADRLTILFTSMIAQLA